MCVTVCLFVCSSIQKPVGTRITVALSTFTASGICLCSSVYTLVCLSVCPSVCLFTYIVIGPSVRPSACLSVCIFIISLSTYIFARLSTCPSVCLPTNILVHQSDCPSGRLSVYYPHPIFTTTMDMSAGCPYPSCRSVPRADCTISYCSSGMD